MLSTIDTPTYLAYAFIVAYIIIERVLRKGAAARSISKADRSSESDAHSTSIVLSIMGVHFLLLVCATVLQKNAAFDDDKNSMFARWLGVAFMACGLSLRYWAAVILGRFYSRTLRIQKNQVVIRQAPYSIIRHPGYLGMWLLGMGGCLAVGMPTVLWLVDVTMVVGALHYRILTEEKMLTKRFGEDYKHYCLNTSWKMIPLVY